MNFRVLCDRSSQRQQRYAPVLDQLVAESVVLNPTSSGISGQVKRFGS